MSNSAIDITTMQDRAEGIDRYLKSCPSYHCKGEQREFVADKKVHGIFYRCSSCKHLMSRLALEDIGYEKTAKLECDQCKDPLYITHQEHGGWLLSCRKIGCKTPLGFYSVDSENLHSMLYIFFNQKEVNPDV